MSSMAEGSPRRHPALAERGEALAARFEQLYARYGRAFWTLHSMWALLTGIAVLVLAHNRYGFVPWVVLFLALTWASTLVFTRFAARWQSRALRFARGFVSYLTRIMYQETLFFLLPFYFYSTTPWSWNALFVIMLAALAILSCFDLVFDRLLRERRAFALGFFAVVTFSALQFFLPLAFHVRIHHGAYLAAVASFLAAIPLAYSAHDLRDPMRVLRLLAALLVIVAIVRLARPAVPPVPLRLAKIRLSADLDPRTLHTSSELSSRVDVSRLRSGRLYAVATINAPTTLPTSVALRFRCAGIPTQPSRSLDVIAHERGFRVWNSLRPGPTGFVPGPCAVEVVTTEGQLIGRRRFELVGPGG